MLPLRRRITPILATLLGAPITAEYLQAYLSFTGDVLALLTGLLFLGPLYGAAVLLIREVAVRTGRGWPGVLLMAAAFGIAMSGLIDLSLFGEHRADVAYWSELREPTVISPLGVSVYQALTWVAGHVVMSVGVPLALLYRFAPAQRGRPMLGKPGLGVAVALFGATATMVHLDSRRVYDYVPSGEQVGAVLAVVVVLGGLAFTRLGGPLTPKSVSRSRVRTSTIALTAVAAIVLPGLLPPTWFGVLGEAVVLIAVGTAVAWWSVRRDWGAREIGVLAASAVVGGTLIGFLNPTPEGVSPVAKVIQNAILLVVALAIVGVARGQRRHYDSSMAVTVLLEFHFKPESVSAAREVLGRALGDTRKFPGALAIDVIIDEEDDAHWIVYERWDSIEHDEAYRAFRAGDGKIVDLPPLLAAPPVKTRYLDSEV